MTTDKYQSQDESQISNGSTVKPVQLLSSDESDHTTLSPQRSKQDRPLPSQANDEKNVPLAQPVRGLSEDAIDLRAWIKDTVREHDGDHSIRRHTGFTFSNLDVSGHQSTVRLQSTVASTVLTPLRRMGSFMRPESESGAQILHDCHGFLKEGEMLFVLGRPGSGCSTLLKTIAGRHQGLTIGDNSVIEYNGIARKLMHKQFRGEVLYNEEMDCHFPHLTVSQTLAFAAEARAPRHLTNYKSAKDYTAQIVDVALRVFKLKQAANTKVGDDFVRGVSGGERKRTSIAEMALSRAPLSLWDNSTRGLDAASALDFASTLRTAADITSSSSVVTIYQASQAIYELFDRVTVLYRGRQIFFGPRDRAKAYFEEMGYECPERMTTGDFLTSITNPSERKVRPGFEARVPRAPQDFQSYWKDSSDFTMLRDQIDALRKRDRTNSIAQFQNSRRAEQGRGVRTRSPYTLSLAQQVSLCTRRAFQRLWNDFSSTVSLVFGTLAMALIMGSIFYGTEPNTDALFSKGGILFFAILINALNAVSEINTLYAKRPIIAKQASYAMCHPSAEAISAVVADVPIKLVTAICFNIILYFLGGLRVAQGPFFIFFLFGFVVNLAMSFAFKTVGALTKSVSQAMTAAGLLVLAIVIYTGYTIPRPNMRPWFKWMSWINPVAYVFEGLLVNELHGQNFECSTFVPSYRDGARTFVCSSRGAEAGEETVSGDAFFNLSFGFSYSHLWRNFGILCAFLLFFLVAYLLASEYGPATGSSADILIFRKAISGNKNKDAPSDEETQHTSIPASQIMDAHPHESSSIPVQKPVPSNVFSWKRLNYDISVPTGTRRLLDEVDGWVKPGTLTALMGASGAGKTTMLNVLAQRISMGVVTGDVRVDSLALDDSFQRKTGYVQQQDLHLETSTVKEALEFSALLRQPRSTKKADKLRYVNEIIDLLDMSEFANAVVGLPGQGLNVEQRKLLSIGVELAAKPEFLIFLDEPTSGLDSQSSWAIIKVLRRLADRGTAILCTIHQPSSVLFQEFDRLLLLAKGGKTVYFGDIGPSSKTLISYFTNHGGAPCDPDANPAEWMLQVINTQTHDWHQEWLDSLEFESVQAELETLHAQHAVDTSTTKRSSSSEFAMPLVQQISHTTLRVFQQYWRTPEYIWSKLLLGTLSALFIGFSFFKSDSTQQGMQNIMFSLFMLTSIFTTLVQQIMPRFVTQRSLYEVRERPAKVYSWIAFLFANIVVELPWQTLLSVLVFVSYYYPVGFWQHAEPEFNERAGLMFFYILSFFLFASTFAQMVVAALPDEGTAGALATLLFSLTLIFNGVVQPASSLPQFWIFMYRVSPLTYLISGMLSTALHNRPLNCAPSELNIFEPPSGQTCGAYLADYLSNGAPGRLLNPTSTTNCEYCPLRSADQFLASIAANWDDRWRNLGFMWVYIVFNICATFALYYLARVKTGPLLNVVKIKTFFDRKKGQRSAHAGLDREEVDKEEAEEEDERFRLARRYSRKVEVQPRAY